MRTKPIEISLILCGYNAESTVAGSLDSAAAQTLRALEIICVNDGSTDRTGEIFQAYAQKDPRIKIIEHPKNKGLLAARQTGVNNASGKYIMFLDLDDALVPEACEELSEKMNESDADMIQFDTDLSYESEEDRIARVTMDSHYFSLKCKDSLNSSDEILQACFIDKKFAWNVWSKIYKVELARKVYSYVPKDMKVVMAEDTFAFFLAASMTKKMLFVDKKYYIYSVGCGVSGNTDLRKAESSLDVYCTLIKPYADAHKSPMLHQVSEELGKLFRACISYKLIAEPPPYKNTVEREFKQFGSECIARMLTESWDFLGVHSVKTFFLDCCSEISANLSEKIRNIGIICMDARLSEPLQEIIKTLYNAGYQTEVFAKRRFIESAKNKLSGCQCKELPEGSSEIISFFDKSKNDAYVISYGEKPDYDFVSLLLFKLRFSDKKPFLAFLDKEVSQLNCHDKILLSTADCVFGNSSELASLFGNIGVLSRNKNMTDQLRKLISLFEKENEKNQEILFSVRQCMKKTAWDALSALGCPGFGKDISFNREELEQKIAVNGSPLSADDYILIRESGFFDDEYYKKQFPDTVIEDPIIHFSKIGMHRMAAPSAIFSPEIYCLANPDLYPLQINPLAHYLRHGIYEGRKIHSPVYNMIRDSIYFDEDRYRREYGNELNNLTPAAHYLMIGWKKGCLPSELFVDKSYADVYWDCEMSGLNPLYHYLGWGEKEGRCSFPLNPRYEEYFPEDYDIKDFRNRQDKYLIAIHQLDFTGVPILAKMVAEIFSGTRNAAIISPMDGPLRESCVKAGIPVLIDSDFYLRNERAVFYKENGFGACLYNTLGLIKTFMRNTDAIPSALWIHDNITADSIPEKIRKEIKFAPTLFATSKTTTEMVQDYNPSVGYLPYPIKDKGTGHKENIPQKIRFGVFGVYSNRKGQDLAIEAFKKLPGSLKEKAELHLIGNVILPEYAEKLQKMAEGEKNIHFVPAEKNAEAYHKLYDNLEVQICPSRTDPMPLVVFDGMMHGCPLILSDTVGQSEYINGENGYVFPAEDVSALKECMIKMIENREQFPEFSKAVRKTFLNNFEFEKASLAIRKVLDEVKTYF